MIKKYITNSYEETQKVGAEFALQLKEGDIIALDGDLGAGKTAFTRGFARYFGIEKGVSSPTFIIMHRYTGSEVINHYDLYRLNDYDELLDIGFEEQIESGISIIEWPDIFIEYLPDDKIIITITRLGENERKISLEDF